MCTIKRIFRIKNNIKRQIKEKIGPLSIFMFLNHKNAKTISASLKAITRLSIIGFMLHSELS